MISSKSTTEGDFADWFRQLFEKRCGSHRDYLIEYLRNHNGTLLFEVILPGQDPHIINYPHDDLVLLEIVKRQRSYEALPESERHQVAKRIGVRSKKCAGVFADWEAFTAWYEATQGIDYLYEGKPIEGFVLEDDAGWHVKMKLDYYTFWKQMRSSLDALKKGKTPKIPGHSNYPEEAARVITYMTQLPPARIQGMNIGDLRKQFLAEAFVPESESTETLATLA